MNAQTLIREIQAEFPNAMRSEIAAAFGLDPANVSLIILAGGGERRGKKGSRKQCRDLIDEIRRYANKRLGGRVEIIPKRGEMAILCVNERYIA